MRRNPSHSFFNPYSRLEGTLLVRHAVHGEVIPLLWIGGWSVSPSFHPFGLPSTPLGRRILLIDLTSSRCVDEFVSTVAETIGSLQTPVDIAAWSMGTLLAIQAQTLLPDRVRRMVLFGATPKFARDRDSGWSHGYAPSTIRSMKRRLRVQREQVLTDFHRMMLGADHRLATLAAGPDQRQIEGVLAPAHDSFPVGSSPWSTEALGAGLELLESFDLRHLLQDVHSRTLLIHGTDDLVCPVNAGRWMAERIAAAEWIEVRGAGHVPHSLLHPQIRRRVEVFLS